jgi:hypothetical protein
MRALVFLLAAFAAAGCAHPHSVDDPSKEAEGDANGAGKKPADSGDAATANSAKDTAAPTAPSRARQNPEDVPVATTSDALLQPGAEDKVRDKLGIGPKEALPEAVRRFQREHDLPATGALDHATVQKLGLEPDAVFKKAEDGPS